MADTTNFRNGFTIKLDGELFSIAEFQHVKPGKGNAFVRTRLKNVQTGAVIDRTFRSGDKVEEVRIERRESQFLYAEGEQFHFMDAETYDQSVISLAMVGDRIYTDIEMARRAGAFGVLVLSGEATRADAEASSEAIDLVAPSLKEFGEDLERARAEGSMP